MTTVNLDSSALTSAFEQLCHKLLDLTGRNRLINFKHTAGKSLQFIEGHPAAIYQRLVEANNKASISVSDCQNHPEGTGWSATVAYKVEAERLQGLAREVGQHQVGSGLRPLQPHDVSRRQVGQGNFVTTLSELGAFVDDRFTKGNRDIVCGIASAKAAGQPYRWAVEAVTTTRPVRLGLGGFGQPNQRICTDSDFFEQLLEAPGFRQP